MIISSCGGLALGTYGTHEHLRTNFKLDQNKNQLQHFKSEKYTKDSIISLWGKPDATGVDGSHNTITYYNGKNWSGVGAFIAVVPVPLIIPSGNKKQTFYFKNNQCVGLVQEYGEVKSAFGFMCGSNECKFVAGRTDNGKVKGETNWSKELSTKYYPPLQIKLKKANNAQ